MAPQTDEKRSCTHLIDLSSETLLLILSQVPLKSFLDLVQTCCFLRYFMRSNGSRICNDAIKSRFPFQAKLLVSELDSGWLVPTHAKFKTDEKLWRDILEINWERLSFEKVPMSKFSLLGEIQPDMSGFLKIATPGPQYLFFLERKLLATSCPYIPREICSPWYWHWPHRDTFVNGKVVFSFDTCETGVKTNSTDGGLIGLLQEMNKMQILVLNGQFNERGIFILKWAKKTSMKNKLGKRFPRELVWYYGVKHLDAMKLQLEGQEAYADEIVQSVHSASESSMSGAYLAQRLNIRYVLK